MLTRCVFARGGSIKPFNILRDIPRGFTLIFGEKGQYLMLEYASILEVGVKWLGFG
jgi:hypothetical protein